MPCLSPLSRTGTRSLGSDKGWFHRTDWEVPPQLLNCCPLAPQSPFFIHFLQHTSSGASGIERWEERAQKNIKRTTETQQNRPFQDLFHLIFAPRHYFLQCTATQSENTCWIWATSLKTVSSPKRTLLHFIIHIIVVFFFLYFTLHIYTKKRRWQLKKI